MACQRCGGGSVSASNRPSSKSDCGCGCTDAPTTLRCTPAFAGGLLRPRFFDGMVLTARDLSDTQDYWRKKRQLTNRALGTGVVWGLRTEWDGKSGAFKLGPGYAIDCCGNDVVVEGCEVVSAAAVIDRSDPVIGKLVTASRRSLTHGEHAVEGVKENRSMRAHLVLKYAESVADQRTVGDARCNNGETRSEVSRLRESAVLCIAPIPAPTRGPIDALLDGVGKLAAAESDATPTEDKVDATPPLYLVIRSGTDEWVTPASVNDAGELRFEAIGVSADHPDGVQLEIRPGPGWLIAAGTVMDEEERYAARASAPWALALTWGATPDDKDPKAAWRVTELTLVEASGSGAVKLEKDFVVRLVGTGGDALHARIGSSEFRLVSELRETRFACLAPLKPDVSPRGLLAGALYAVMASAESQGDPGGPALVATWAATLAAELLGGDGSTERRDQIFALLDTLLDAWCWGLVYPGPRCETSHHGVVLGTVTLSPSGTVLSFDPWEGRRHVLTGPQVTHWLGQLGVAPPDVLVSRVARAVCCAAGREAPSVPAYTNLAFDDGAAHPFGAGAIAVSGSAAMIIGPEDVVAPYLAATGVDFVREETVSDAGFVRAVVAAASTVGSPASHGAWVRRSCGTVHLLTAATADDLAKRDAKRQRLARAVEQIAVTTGLAPLEHQPYRELVEALSRRVVLGTGGPTVSAILTLEPEAYLAESGLTPKEVDDRFAAAAKALDKVADTVRSVRTAALPLYRTNLVEHREALATKLASLKLGKSAVDDAIVEVRGT